MNSDNHFFEGAEKLLEIWFDCGTAEENKSLRVIPRSELESLLDMAQCQIISSISSPFMDSYVLSESSMFISDNRFILKTCGTTRLLNTVERLLHIANAYCGVTKVLNLYYSRKNFTRPELQHSIHSSFEAEVDFLDGHFEEGVAYCIGSLKQDRWYLYTLTPSYGPLPHADQTLEILMHDMDPTIANIFSKNTCSNALEARKLAQIDDLVPSGTMIDDKLFEPCGYSMNGILTNSDQYVTIHITPEAEFSYCSFETNQDQMCLFEQTCRVLERFKPGRFLMTVFANEAAVSGKKTQQELWERDIPGYGRKDLQFLRLPQDTLVYAQYKKIIHS